jgi:hypothetical protein
VAATRRASLSASSLAIAARDAILLAVRYHVQLGAAAERIAGVLADRGIDVSGRTILRWVQKFGPALADAVRQHRKTLVTTWLVDETYVKILGKWHYLYRGVDLDGQVLDCWLSATRDYRRLRHSSDEPSHRPAVSLNTSLPTKPPSIHPPSARTLQMPGTRRPASTTG